MTDRDLIQKLKLLQNVHPDKKWVAFCREELLNKFSKKEETVIGEIISPVTAINAINFFNQLLFGAFRLSPVKATVTAVIMILMVGGLLFNLSQNSLPGSVFYSLKLDLEETALKLSPEGESRLLLQTKFAQKRVEEISALSGDAESDTEVMAPVIERYKEEISNAQKYLVQEKDSEKALKVAKILHQSTEKYQASLINAASKAKDGEREKLSEALRYTEDANLKALTVLSSSGDESPKFLQQWKEKIELRISSIESRILGIEDKNILEPVGKLIEKATLLLEEGTPSALDEASGLIKEAESYLSY